MEAGEDAAREAAWGALFDAGTSAAQLSEIAQACPEFAPWIEQHPNCYPALSAWLRENAAEYLTEPDADPGAEYLAEPGADPSADHSAASCADPGASTSEVTAATPRRWSWKVLSVLAGAGVVVVAAATVWAVPIVLRQLSDAGITVPGMGGSQTGARALAGPPVYVGDELDWFLLTDEQVKTLAPGATDIKRNAHFESVGETEGFHPSKDGCWFGDPYGSGSIVGVRVASWKGGSGPISSNEVFQFPSTDVADKYFRDWVDTAKACPNFDMLDAGNAIISKETTSVTGSPADDLVVISRTSKSDQGNDAYAYAFALEGNVILSLYGTESDAKRLADLARTQVTSARERLVEKIGYR